MAEALRDDPYRQDSGRAGAAGRMDAATPVPLLLAVLLLIGSG